MPFIELAAAALLAQAAAAPPTGPVGGQPPVHVEAQEASWDVGAGQAQLKGGVLLRRGSLLLRSPEARFRPETGQVEATGGVLLVDGARAIVARAIRGEIGGVYEAEAPSVFFVEDPAALALAGSAEEAERTSRRRLTLRADRATGSADGGITLSGARATLCNCPAGEAPTWEVRASSADVRPGERAILSWPVLWVTPRFLFVDRPVPIMALPWLWVPLGERQSGLLLPDFKRTNSAGVTLVEPLFLTLGRSADATVWAGWAIGGTKLRGPTGALELRWAPAESSSGRVVLDYLHDLRAEAGGTTGARVAVTGFHGQRIGTQTDLRLELALVGDPLYARDFTLDLLLRGATYGRSALLLSRRGDESVFEAGGAWLLPIAADGSLFRVAGLSYGIFGSGLPTVHRGPALAARLLPTQLAAGVLASGRAELARFGPLSGTTSDSGADGIGPGDLGWVPSRPDSGQLDGRFQPGERLAATRALLRAELSRPLLLGRWLRFVPALRGAASAYAFDAAVEPLANAWAIASATAETEIARRFGALRHSIVPRLAWRWGTGVTGSRLPSFGYDGWDRAAESPPGASPTFAGPRLVSAAQPGVFHQGRASVETRVDGPAGQLLHFELGQDLDLRSGELAESFATLRLATGPVSASGSLRYSGFATRPAVTPGTALRVEDWTEVRGALRLARAGYDLHAEIRSIGAGGSPSAQGGPDALFDLRPTPLARSAAVAAGFRLPVGPATLVYDLYFPPRDVAAPLCDGEGTRTVRAYSIQQQAGSLVWDSPCRCFRATITVKYNDCGGFGFTGGIDLSPKPAGK